jgi:hypothetical protein
MPRLFLWARHFSFRFLEIDPARERRRDRGLRAGRTALGRKGAGMGIRQGVMAGGKHVKNSIAYESFFTIL